MKIAAAQAYCILDTVGSAILTKSGDISVVYLMELPEAYSLDTADLEQRHNEFFRAFQYVRNGFIHKQDIFLRRKFKSDYVIDIPRKLNADTLRAENTFTISASFPLHSRHSPVWRRLIRLIRWITVRN